VKYCSKQCQSLGWKEHSENCAKVVDMGKRDADGNPIQQTMKQKIAAKKREIDRLKKQLEKKKNEVHLAHQSFWAAKRELNALIESERNEPVDISDEEKKTILKYLKDLYTHSHGVDSAEIENEYETYETYFVRVSVTTPKSLEIPVDGEDRKRYYDSESLAGQLDVFAEIENDRMHLRDYFKRSLTEKFENLTKKVKFPPPPKIKKLLQKAKITLNLQPMVLVQTWHQLEEENKELGNPVKFGFVF